MSNIDSSSLVRVPDEIMKIPASEGWALKMSDFLNSSFLEKNKPIFFIMGEYHNGKFVPYDDTGFTQDSLLEAYHNLLETGKNGSMALYIAQDVDLDNIYLN